MSISCAKLTFYRFGSIVLFVKSAPLQRPRFLLFEVQILTDSNTSTKHGWQGPLLLLLTAFIWGTSCVAQSVGMETFQAFTFNGIRTLLGALVLLPVLLIRHVLSQRGASESEKKALRRIRSNTLRKGIRIGLVFFIACNFQQCAFYYSTSGKIALITSLYMFFVPLLGLFIHKRIPLLTWVSIAAGFVGLYFLCINPQDLQAVNLGDFLAFICAFFYGIHILLIEKAADEIDGPLLSFIQFLLSGILTCTLMFLFETPQLAAIKSALPSILYSGLLSCGVAYTLQIIGQKRTEATVASLLMCSESMFAVIASGLVLHEILTGRELIGCVIMLIAIVLSQVPG